MGGLPLLVVAFLSKAETILRRLCGAVSFQHVSNAFGLDFTHYSCASHCGSKPEIFFGFDFVSYQYDDFMV